MFCAKHCVLVRIREAAAAPQHGHDGFLGADEKGAGEDVFEKEGQRGPRGWCEESAPRKDDGRKDDGGAH